MHKTLKIDNRMKKENKLKNLIKDKAKYKFNILFIGESEVGTKTSLINRIKEGKFIPYCTQMVFLKYYTPSNANQVHFWGQADRDSYVKAINDILKDYIEPIVIFKEEE